MRHYTANYVANIKEPEIMKKSFFAVLFVLFGVAAFGQGFSTVAVATFDTIGGISRDDAEVVTELFVTELVASREVSVVDRFNFDKIIAEMKFQVSDWSNSSKTAALGNALNAQYIIRGQLMKMSNNMFWTATMIDVNTAQVLYSAREQLKDMVEIYDKIPSFTSRILQNMPPPNFFVGRWTSERGSMKCILEFKKDGTIIVERFDHYDNGHISSSNG
jgi:TolB-like protein